MRLSAGDAMKEAIANGRVVFHDNGVLVIITDTTNIDPVRHGHWLDRYATEQVKPWEGRYKCTECGVCINQSWYQYCPNCGAIMMDGDVK